MKKVLMVASVASMIDLFNRNNIRLLQELGYTVEVAANFEFGLAVSKEKIENYKKELLLNDVKIHQINFSRKPYSLQNIKAYRELRRILRQEEYYLIHSHTPVGSALVRLASIGTNIPNIYTAHGFHFYKGAPIKNWVLYYPIEYLLAFITNLIITINMEDYYRSKSFPHSKKEFVPGVGIDREKYVKNEYFRKEIRKELNISENEIVVMSVGELNDNKNQKIIIEALKYMGKENVHYIICGVGPNLVKLKELSKKYNLQNQIHFLGFRTNIHEILNAADIFVFPSFREGLPVSIMEAMATSLPIVASNVRGNNTLVEDGKGGYLFNPNSYQELAESLMILIKEPLLRIEFGVFNRNKSKEYSIKNISIKMKKIYQKELLKGEKR